MTQYAFPSTLTANESALRQVTNADVFTSPITGATKTLTRGGARWYMEMMFRNLQGAKRGDLMGFLAQVDGMTHRINVGDHAYLEARGALGVTIIVDGASQSGKTLSVKQSAAGTSSVTGFFLRGDMLSYLGSDGKYELKMVTTDFNLSSGTGDVSIWPPIRNAPADEAAIETTSPIGTFMLASPLVDRSDRPGGSLGTMSDISIQLVEDIA